MQGMLVSAYAALHPEVSASIRKAFCIQWVDDLHSDLIEHGQTTTVKMGYENRAQTVIWLQLTRYQIHQFK